MPTLPKVVRIGYGIYETRQELEDAESKAWLAIPLSERQEIMKKLSAEYDTPEKRASYIARLKKKYA